MKRIENLRKGIEIVCSYELKKSNVECIVSDAHNIAIRNDDGAKLSHGSLNV